MVPENNDELRIHHYFFSRHLSPALCHPIPSIHPMVSGAFPYWISVMAL